MKISQKTSLIISTSVDHRSFPKVIVKHDWHF